MNKNIAFALAATVATLAIPASVFAAEATQPVQAAADSVAPAAKVTTGKMLYSADGRRIASIYRVTSEGAPQVILDGKLITVPVSSLSEANGKVTTSLSKPELARAR
jgi:predicted permease